MADVFRQQPIDSGMQISGNVPPELKEMLNTQPQQQPQQQAQPQPQQQAQPQPQPSPTPVKSRATIGPQYVARGVLSGMLDKLDTAIYGEVQLPSKGRFYDDVANNGILHVRPMTGAEEEILATPRYVKKNEAIDMIFKNCIQEKIDPAKLLTIDRNYLLIWLRGISYDPIYEVEVRCTECGEKSKQEINLNELEVTYCPEDFSLDSLKGALPKSGWNFSYRLSTGSDELAVARYRDKRGREAGTGNRTDDTLTYRTSLLLNNIGEISNTSELHILLKRLPVADGGYLRSLVNEPPFGVDTTIGLVCGICGAEYSVDLPMEASFFFPQYRKKEENQEK